MASKFFTLTPCRVIDTRNPVGSYGAPSLVAEADRTVVFGDSARRDRSGNQRRGCAADGRSGVSDALAGGPAESARRDENFNKGATKANNAIIPLGALADIAVHCGQGTGTTDMVIDVNGYFQ